VPVRTFADWNETEPGFLEADLVAHCGWSTEGAYLNTLVLTDVATGWIECLALLTKGRDGVVHALECARQLIPFPIRGLDTDNGSEFLNAELLGYCERERITFTRGRAQKNGAVIRQLVGYDRFEGVRAYRQLNELYRAMRLYVNFFQPSMKLRKKHRAGSKVHRTYDRAQTPFQRLCHAGVLPRPKREHLESIYEALDPVRLLQQIQVLQDALWRHAVQRTPDALCETEQAESEQEVSFEPLLCGIPGDSGQRRIVVKPSLQSLEKAGKRKYHRSKQPRSPRWWRTRKDPFDGVWNEICRWLAANPERTAKSLLQELQKRHPDNYPDSLLRALQRRVQGWRAKALVVFDDRWLHEEVLAWQGLPRPLQAEVETTEGQEPASPCAPMVSFSQIP